MDTKKGWALEQVSRFLRFGTGLNLFHCRDVE